MSDSRDAERDGGTGAAGPVVRWARVPAPVGPLLVAATSAGLRRIAFENTRRPIAPGADWVEDPAALAGAVEQLRAWFAGELRDFELALDAPGTDFQRDVWAAVAAIPYGATATYADVARATGRPGASRAAGAANGANPLPIVVPCHRVGGADGSLTGFSGGLETKRRLLAHEAEHAGPGTRRQRFAADQLALF